MKPVQSIHALLVAAVLLLASVVVQPAVADQLDDFRAQGQIGERSDGYAEARSGASAAAQSLVKKVNAQRKAIYEKQAKQQNVPVEQVGRVYAQEIVEKLPAGSWVKTGSGWRQK